MPPEPERKIEQWLGRYARKRREQAGDRFEVHPATRRLWQGELEKQRCPAKPARSRWTAGFWPRLALGGALFAALAAAVLLLFEFPESQRAGFDLAQESNLPRLAPAPGPADKSQGENLKRDDFPALGRAQSNLEDGRYRADPAAPERATRLWPAPAADADRQLGLTVTPPPPGSPAANRHLTELRETPAATKQIQQRSRMKNAFANSLNVMNTFEVQQSGDQIWLIDEDGSTYSGRFLPDKTNALAPAGPALARREIERARPDTPAQKGEGLAGTYTFRAAGTNQSLQKLIVVNGQFLYSNAVVRMQTVPAGAAPAAQNLIPMLQNSRVRGTAVIGGRNEVPIDGVPVASPPGRP